MESSKTKRAKGSRPSPSTPNKFRVDGALMSILSELNGQPADLEPLAVSSCMDMSQVERQIQLGQLLPDSGRTRRVTTVLSSLVILCFLVAGMIWWRLLN